jgi:hypothetical protein
MDLKDKRDDGLCICSCKTPEDVPAPKTSTSLVNVPTSITYGLATFPLQGSCLVFLGVNRSARNFLLCCSKSRLPLRWPLVPAEDSPTRQPQCTELSVVLFEIASFTSHQHHAASLL